MPDPKRPTKRKRNNPTQTHRTAPKNPKPVICTRVPIVSQMHLPINKLVWNIHSNTISTDFSHFWDNNWRNIRKLTGLNMRTRHTTQRRSLQPLTETRVLTMTNHSRYPHTWSTKDAHQRTRVTVRQIMIRVTAAPRTVNWPRQMTTWCLKRRRRVVPKR